MAGFPVKSIMANHRVHTSLPGREIPLPIEIHYRGNRIRTARHRSWENHRIGEQTLSVGMPDADACANGKGVTRWP